MTVCELRDKLEGNVILEILSPGVPGEDLTTSYLGPVSQFRDRERSFFAEDSVHLIQLFENGQGLTVYI